MGKRGIILLMVLLFLVSCGGGGTDPFVDSPFSLEITVLGSGSSDIAVAIWNDIELNYERAFKHGKNERINAVSTLPFTISEQYHVNVIAYNMNGEISERLIEFQPLMPGKYQVSIRNWQSGLGTVVRKWVIKAYSDTTTKEIVFRDSIYSVLHQPDPDIACIGNIDKNGRLTTTNKNLFPSLFNIPALNLTDASSSDVVGLINFSDTYYIALKNLETGECRIFEKQIRVGENSFNLIWNEGSKFNITSSPIKRQIGETDIITKIDTSVAIPLVNKLEQNFPNPYN